MELIDPELEEFPEQEVLRYMKVALFCTQANASRRPLMNQVFEMLSRDIRINEQEITPPGFFQESGGLGILQSKEKLSESSTCCNVSSASVTITEVTSR